MESQKRRTNLRFLTYPGMFFILLPKNFFRLLKNQQIYSQIL